MKSCLYPSFFEQLLKQKTFIAAWIPAADLKESFLRKTCVRGEKKRGEPLVVRWRTVFALGGSIQFKF